MNKTLSALFGFVDRFASPKRSLEWVGLEDYGNNFGMLIAITRGETLSPQSLQNDGGQP